MPQMSIPISARPLSLFSRRGDTFAVPEFVFKACSLHPANSSLRGLLFNAGCRLTYKFAAEDRCIGNESIRHLHRLRNTRCSTGQAPIAPAVSRMMACPVERSIRSFGRLHVLTCLIELKGKAPDCMCFSLELRANDSTA